MGYGDSTTNVEIRKGDAQAVADVVKRHVEPRVMDVKGPDGRTAQVLLAAELLKPMSVKPFLDAYLTRPERKKGRTTLYDLLSFIDFVKRHATKHSVVFANTIGDRPSVEAIFDYHEARGRDVARPNREADAPALPPAGTSDGAAALSPQSVPQDENPAERPDWCDHRALYSFPISESWSAWLEIFKQKEIPTDRFAEFMEDHVAEIQPPVPRFTLAREFRETSGLPLASPEHVLDVSKGLSLRVASTVSEFKKLQSGESRMEFKTEHTDERGEPLKVPAAFLIGVQLFKGGVAYEVPVKLRYRVNQGRVTWRLEPYGLDRVRESALDAALNQIAAETGLPVFNGEPPKAQ